VKVEGAATIGSNRASPVQSRRLASATRLARTLLAEELGSVEQAIAAAFQRFLDKLAEDDQEARRTLKELRTHAQSFTAEPYFLELLQAQANRSERRRRGVYFTPGPVVEYIVRRIEQLVPEGPLRIVDPACGGGVFLLGVARLAGKRPGSSLAGFDVSQAAVTVTRRLLEDANVTAHVECTNPLLAGEALAETLVDASSTLIVVGNPPYANYGRLNRGPWIDGLLVDYRRGIREQKVNLTDDFIKFLRWGQYWIDRAGRGVLAMITSRTYLSGVTHRGMRGSLARSFPSMEIVDLHGDGEVNDENIFPIRRGVAISILANVEPASAFPVRRTYTSRRGSRADKFASLTIEGQASSVNLVPRPPDWLFVPSAKNGSARSPREYLAWPRLDEILHEFISGVQTKNDALFVDFERATLERRMSAHLGERFNSDNVRPYVVGPFDRRWIYYHPELLGRARWPVMRHLVSIENNLALVFVRQSTSTDDYDHALVVDALASDRVFYSRRGAPFVAPLWRIDVASLDASSQTPVPNFRTDWMDRLATRLGMRPHAEDLLGYVYAILHAPPYRRRYLSELQRDFPRIPWPSSRASFERLAEQGKHLIELHLGDSAQGTAVELVGEPNRLVIERGFPKLNGGVVQLNRSSGFRIPSVDTWMFQVGSYRVIERWLKARQGRKLVGSDFVHLAWLIDVAEKTRRLSEAIGLTFEEAANP